MKIIDCFASVIAIMKLHRIHGKWGTIRWSVKSVASLKWAIIYHGKCMGRMYGLTNGRNICVSIGVECEDGRHFPKSCTMRRTRVSEQSVRIGDGGSEKRKGEKKTMAEKMDGQQSKRMKYYTSLFMSKRTEKCHCLASNLIETTFHLRLILDIFLFWRDGYLSLRPHFRTVRSQCSANICVCIELWLRVWASDIV